MIVTDMPVEAQIAYARNPRNNYAAIDAVKASIAEFGFRQLIVVDVMAALHGLDALARDMERKWGSCRLSALVPEDLARRFYSQHRKVSMARRREEGPEAGGGRLRRHQACRSLPD